MSEKCCRCTANGFFQDNHDDWWCESCVSVQFARAIERIGEIKALPKRPDNFEEMDAFFIAWDEAVGEGDYWDYSLCPHCGHINWCDLGNLCDLTVADDEACQCHHCQKYYLFRHEAMTEEESYFWFLVNRQSEIEDKMLNPVLEFNEKEIMFPGRKKHFADISTQYALDHKQEILANHANWLRGLEFPDD